jgi:DNA replication protein DnaC
LSRPIAGKRFKSISRRASQVIESHRSMNGLKLAGTGKTHLAIAIGRYCIRAGLRGRFFNTVDLVNRLEAEARAGRQGRIADYLTRKDFTVFDELGYLPTTPKPAPRTTLLAR